MMIFRKFGKVIKRQVRQAGQHGEQVITAARISLMKHKIHHQLLDFAVAENENISNLVLSKGKKPLRIPGAKLHNLQSQNEGFKGLNNKEMRGDFAKIPEENFIHKLDNNATRFSLEELEECESVILEDNPEERQKNSIVDRDIKQFLKFVVKKIANNSRILRTQ